MSTDQNYDPAGSGATNAPKNPSPPATAPLKLDLDPLADFPVKSTALLAFNALSDYRKSLLNRLLLAHKEGAYKEAYLLSGEIERADALTSDLVAQMDSFAESSYRSYKYFYNPDLYDQQELEREKEQERQIEQYRATYIPTLS